MWRRWCSGRRRARPPASRPRRVLLLVAPLVFRAPSDPAVGPGCSVCPWAAARPLAVRAASLRLGVSPRSPARPRHRPRAPQRSPAAARGHHRGLARCDFWPISCVLLQTSSIGGVFRVAFCPVVTNVVNPMAFSLKIVVFGRRLTTFVTGVLTRCSKLLRFDDVCNGYCPRASQPGPVGQVARLSETAIAFARSCARGVETVIAFSGEKWAFLVQFSAALVLLVSMVAVQGRAVVMMVPCWPASVAAEASLVSTSPCRSILCAKKFALFGPGRLRPQGPNEAPAHASCAGGRQGKDCLELKRCTQRVEGT